MVMSNSMEFDTLYSDDMNYLPHRIIVENAGNNLMSSSIFNEDVNTYLELLLSAKTPKSINIPPEVLLIGTSGLFFKK